MWKHWNQVLFCFPENQVKKISAICEPFLTASVVARDTTLPRMTKAVLNDFWAHNNEGIILKKLRYISAVANSQLSICVHNCGIFTDSTFEFKDYNRDTIYKDNAVSESMKWNMGLQSRPLLDI